MTVANFPYIAGPTLLKEDTLTVYEASHIELGKRASLWVFDLPTDSMAEAVDHFHRQLSLAASVYHPDVAPIYIGGAMGRSLYYAQEPLAGTSLANQIALNPPRDRHLFYQYFAPLAHMLRSIGQLAISWERLRLADVTVLDSGRFRFQRWNPLCSFDRVPLAGGLGDRLAAMPGLFFAEDVFDFDHNARTLARWMFEVMAPSGRTLETALKNFQAALIEKRKKTDPEPRFIPDIDPQIERFIYKLAIPTLQGGFDSMDDVVDAMERLRRSDTLEDWPIPPGIGGRPAIPAAKRYADISALPPGEQAPGQLTDFTRFTGQRLGFKRSKAFVPLIILLVAIVLGVGGYIAYSLMGQTNEPPMASITLLKTTAGINERVIFDGSQSHDPDGDLLNYYWRVVEPTDAGTDYYISRNRTPAAATTSIQFFRPGRYRISLQVTDGTEFSDPDYAVVTITE